MKARRIVSVVLNVLIAVLTVIAYRSERITFLRYFTNLSNIFCAVTALIIAICSLRKSPVPRAAAMFKFMSTTAMTLTMMTVVLFLAPMETTIGKSYFHLFSGNQIFSHFICPVLAIVSFTLFDDIPPIPGKQAWLGMIPMLIYAPVYILEVVFLKNWRDFYNFTFGGKNALAVVMLFAMAAVTWLFSFLLWKILCKRQKQISKRSN